MMADVVETPRLTDVEEQARVDASLKHERLMMKRANRNKYMTNYRKYLKLLPCLSHLRRYRESVLTFKSRTGVNCSAYVTLDDTLVLTIDHDGGMTEDRKYPLADKPDAKKISRQAIIAVYKDE
jgi:hypothetical protein